MQKLLNISQNSVYFHGNSFLLQCHQIRDLLCRFLWSLLVRNDLCLEKFHMDEQIKNTQKVRLFLWMLLCPRTVHSNYYRKNFRTPIYSRVQFWNRNRTGRISRGFLSQTSWTTSSNKSDRIIDGKGIKTDRIDREMNSSSRFAQLTRRG